jgi:uncharacterized peroxidase-related enzyme
MAFIELIGDDSGSEHARRLVDGARDGAGEVPNFVRLFAHRPDVYDAWQGLKAAVADGMDLRRYELATLAAACELRSTYCAAAHGSILADRFLDADTVRRLAADHRAGGLDDVDVAVMDLAAKVARDATSVTQADVDRLRDLGLSDRDVLDVVLAATIRCFFSKTLDALDAPADAKYNGLEPALRDALTLGRPIATA